MQPSRDHFTVADFEKMGQFFCDTLLDYCDPDQSKVRSTLRDLDIIHPAAGGSSSSGVGGSAAGGQGSSGQGAARDGGPMDDSDDSDQGDAADGDGALLASTTSAAAASGGKRGGNSGESKRPRRRPSKGRRQGRASVSTSTQSGASASGSVVGGGSSAGVASSGANRRRSHGTSDGGGGGGGGGSTASTSSVSSNTASGAPSSGATTKSGRRAGRRRPAPGAPSAGSTASVTSGGHGSGGGVDGSASTKGGATKMVTDGAGVGGGRRERKTGRSRTGKKGGKVSGQKTKSASGGGSRPGKTSSKISAPLVPVPSAHIVPSADAARGGSSSASPELDSALGGTEEWASPSGATRKHRRGKRVQGNSNRDPDHTSGTGETIVMTDFRGADEESTSLRREDAGGDGSSVARMTRETTWADNNVPSMTRHTLQERPTSGPAGTSAAVSSTASVGTGGQRPPRFDPRSPARWGSAASSGNGGVGNGGSGGGSIGGGSAGGELGVTRSMSNDMARMGVDSLECLESMERNHHERNVDGAAVHGWDGRTSGHAAGSDGQPPGGGHGRSEIERPAAATTASLQDRDRGAAGAVGVTGGQDGAAWDGPGLGGLGSAGVAADGSGQGSGQGSRRIGASALGRSAAAALSGHNGHALQRRAESGNGGDAGGGDTGGAGGKF